MANANGAPDTLEKHQHEVCNAFARAAVAMRDAAHTAENFSIWFSRVNNLQNVPVPPMFNGSYNFLPQFAGPQQQQQQQPQSSEAEQTGKKRKALADPEGKRKRTAKEKKPHDPNAPKRPPSAYLLFQNEVRKSVKDQHPDMSYSQVLAEVSKLWHALTLDEKAPYMQATADSKVIYEKARANYDALSPTEAKGGKEVTTKPPTSKSKTPAASSVTIDKPAAKAITTSDDDDEDESTSSISDNSSDDNEEGVEDEAPEPAQPEPPRKKSKKETVKEPSPPPVKVDKKKKKSEEGKKKK